MSKKLPPGWDLPGEFLERLGESSGRQRSMVSEGQLLVILHKMPSPEDISREGIFFWRNGEGVWASSNGTFGVGPLRAHLDTYSTAVEKLEKAYDAADSATDYFRILENMVPLHRAAANMHIALQSARDSLPEAREIITLRDIAADIDRATEILLIDCRHALEYLAARKAEEQAEFANQSAAASTRLSLVAALFLPLTAITGVFGMTLPSGLENIGPWLFWSIFGLGSLLGIVLGFSMKTKPSSPTRKK